MFIQFNLIKIQGSTPSPAVEWLRYLAYRNRGMLKFQSLKSIKPTEDNDELFEEFDASLDDFFEVCLFDTIVELLD